MSATDADAERRESGSGGIAPLQPAGAAAQASVEKIRGSLVDGFARIHRERMAGLPILHPGLSVAVIGARAWRGDWLGVLITPWCMNLVLVPAAGSDSADVGNNVVLALPAGRFELLRSHEPGIGAFAACSLFSPMHEFADQGAAVATAESVMAQLFEPAAVEIPTAVAAAPAVPVPAGELVGGESLAQEARSGISRRDLLRAAFRSHRTPRLE